MTRLQTLVYRSDRCCTGKLSKCIGLHLHPPWSKHFCWSLILCLHWPNAYSLLQYGFGLMNHVLGPNSRVRSRFVFRHSLDCRTKRRRRHSRNLTGILPLEISRAKSTSGIYRLTFESRIRDCRDKATLTNRKP